MTDVITSDSVASVSLNDAARDPEWFSDAVGVSFEEYGFAIIRDHGISQDLIDDAEATLKTFRREGQMVRLDPANRAHEPQRYDPRRVKIQGKLAGLIRRYH